MRGHTSSTQSKWDIHETEGAVSTDDTKCLMSTPKSGHSIRGGKSLGMVGACRPPYRSAKGMSVHLACAQPRRPPPCPMDLQTVRHEAPGLLWDPWPL